MLIQCWWCTEWCYFVLSTHQFYSMLTLYLTILFYADHIPNGSNLCWLFYGICLTLLLHADYLLTSSFLCWLPNYQVESMLTVYLSILCYAHYVPFQFYVACIPTNFILCWRSTEQCYSMLTLYLPILFHTDCLLNDTILCWPSIKANQLLTNLILCSPSPCHFHLMLPTYLLFQCYLTKGILTREFWVAAAYAPAGHAHLEIPACDVISPYQRPSGITLGIIPVVMFMSL